MIDPDRELMRLLASGEAPSHDPDFELDVAAKVQRRRLARDAVDWSLAGLAAAVILWALGPWLAEAWRALTAGLDDMAPLIIAASGTALALAITWWLPGLIELAPPRD